MLESEYLRLKKEKRIWFGAKGDARPRIKTYLDESEGISSWTWWPNEDAGHNQEAKKEIIQILGPDNPFDYSKPTKLLTRVLELCAKKDALVLDSFGGSGTTAHAVLAQKKRTAATAVSSSSNARPTPTPSPPSASAASSADITALCG
jgi:adenine-specific DNA-methyltransferase